MKIEFRKIPTNPAEFEINLDSVKFLGTFSKISSKLAKISSKIFGKCDVDCCKCGINYQISIDENNNFLVIDGVYSSNEEDDNELIVIEIEDHILDFDELLNSEIESLKSEYHVCDTCKNNDNFVEKEY